MNTPVQGKGGSAQTPANNAPQKNIPMTPAKALEMAGKLFAKGRFADSKSLSRQILTRNPKMTEAANLLAASLGSLGEYKEAIAISKKLVKAMPNNPALYSNLGEYERRAGYLANARVALSKAISLQPNNAQALNNLGIVHFEEDSYEDALASYDSALAINPAFAEAHNNRGNALRSLGRNEEAIAAYQAALAHRENYAEAYNNLGTSLRDSDQVAEAEHAYRKAIAQRPNYVEAYVNLASLLHANSQDVEALRVLGDALRIEDQNPGALIMTARVQSGRGSYDNAEKAARIVLAANRDNTEAMVVLGQILHDQDRYDDAVVLLEKAVATNPKSAEARNFLGVVLKSVGRLDEARESLLEGHRLAPRNWGTLANLNDLLNFSETPELVAEMKAALEGTGDTKLTRYIPLHYAYAKALDDLGQPEQAIDHYITGAKLKRAELKFDEARSTEFFDEIQKIFTKDFIAKAPFKGVSDERPTFIIGMPRSGSTLVEQILSSHPDVYGAGEVKFLSRSLGLLRDRFPGLPVYPGMASKLDATHYETVANHYLEQISAQAGDEKRITDKLLTNYFFVGLAHIMFPKAKFIHTRRNPVDTCLSAFTKLFKDDMPHSYDFGELGRYYKRYEKLMAHWEKVLPKGTMMTMDYEKVVEDIEGSARSLIDFMGLPFDAKCVNFHESDRPVKTASVAQVRKPVYKTSVERWRRYGPALQPLLDALDYKG